MAGYKNFVAAILLAASAANAQQPLCLAPRDPGVRDDGLAGAGSPLPDLPNPLQRLFDAGQDVFAEVETVADGIGPTMNLDNCQGCHANPAAGGSSPANNPQVSFYTQSLNHTTNRLPSFITANGPVREARYKSDGGVHDLFTIAGMKGAGDCKIAQPPFDAELARNNVIFRIPTPVFGAGLIEQIPDWAIIENLDREPDRTQKRTFGIRGKANILLSGNARSGQVNKNGNDGTVSRFGWKAQNKSLLIFSGEAYNVEMGISNELFQTEREENPKCQYLSTPNDTTNPELTGLNVLSDVEKFAAFMRLLAPPKPSTTVPGGSDSITRGRAMFDQAGCGLCHTPALATGKSAIAALSEKQVNLFSDLAVHHMGPRLADGITQGEAGPDEFRTAPLWGLGKRIFFLHDGRASDLVVAIREHRSGPDATTAASEANAVINKFDMLPDTSKQDLLNFLRSL
jgi:CxxC motif-containing protein (DUF1111 family)